jgi:predicted RNA-binding Zn-ribbon protein involved in translation (DUF1610 family)
MSESTVETVECQLCGESFDPTDAGGWCTNPDCGEWKYAGAVLSDDPGAGDDGADDGVAGDGEAEEHDADADAEDRADRADTDEQTGDATADGPPTTDAADEPDISRPDADDAETDPEDAGAANEPSVGESDDDAAVTDDTGTSGETADGEAGESEDVDSIVECVDCGTEVERDANFCPTCGGEVVERTPEAEGELTECPGCGSAVEPEDNFCASCGEDLAAHRGADELTACPDCGADVEEEDAFCAACGEDLDAHREAAADAGADGDASGQDGDDAADDAPSGDPGDGEKAGDAAGDAGTEPGESVDAAPETLSLQAYGGSIDVADGDAIGREVRSLLADAGRPDDEAVRIHREHVRFVREGGQFYIVDLGDNPTAVDGRTLSKGDREPIGPGDEVTLSDVVTLTVGSPDA